MVMLSKCYKVFSLKDFPIVENLLQSMCSIVYLSIHPFSVPTTSWNQPITRHNHTHTHTNIHTHYRQFGIASQPTVHVLCWKTRVPGNPRNTGRSCKLHAHRADARSKPPTLEVYDYNPLHKILFCSEIMQEIIRNCNTKTFRSLLSLYRCFLMVCQLHIRELIMCQNTMQSNLIAHFVLNPLALLGKADGKVFDYGLLLIKQTLFQCQKR